MHDSPASEPTTVPALPTTPEASPVALGTLTPRQHEVLLLVAEGLTIAEIAERLTISPGTVRRHLEHVFAKLDVRTRTAAVARLWRGELRP